MKTIKDNPPRFLVLKREDIEKYLSDGQKENLEDIICEVHGGRMADGKKNQPNLYLVLNIDEPYTQQIWNIMYAHGHVPCADCHDSKKEIFCEPGHCLWYELLAGSQKKD